MDTRPPEVLFATGLHADACDAPAAGVPRIANPVDARPPAALPNEEEVRRLADALVRHVTHSSRSSELRSTPRYAFPRLVELIPIGRGGGLLVEETIVAVGKNIALGGMSVFHQRPLPYRHVLACVDAGPDAVFRIPLDLHWCRFTRLGWYESGGRFTAVTALDRATPGHSALLTPRQSAELLP
ncbi:MAG: hypothetical protein R3C10_05290 [Pirellulales bacterium]|nr:hypothetical protein [Planctomycetales bacterium]